MLEFVIDTLFVIFGGRVFHQRVGIPTGTNCAPLLASLFLFGMRQTSIKNEKKLAQCFNFTFRYIDDVLSPNDYRFGDFVDRIYPIELEMEDATDKGRSSSYLYSSYTNILYFSCNVSILSIDDYLRDNATHNKHNLYCIILPVNIHHIDTGF